MIIDIITIFPKMFKPVLNESILMRGQKKGLVKINIHDLRDYSDDSAKKIDSPAYGGGGMVFRVEPVYKALEAVLGQDFNSRQKKETRIILFTPKGKPLKQAEIGRFLDCQRLVLIAPRYEGIDQRVSDYLVDDEISIGDYVLSGGELAAMVFSDCLVRLIPGVVSDRESVKQESFQNKHLDYPHYTRPKEFKGMKVPEILLSGNHREIKDWRQKEAERITKERRPDLLNQN